MPADMNTVALVVASLALGAGCSSHGDDAASDGGTGAADDVTSMDGGMQPALDAGVEGSGKAGSGDAGLEATAPSEAGPPPVVPDHFPSASYAYEARAWLNADPADVRYYLTIAEVPFASHSVCGNTWANGDCFSLMYMDTDRIYLPAPGSPSGCAPLEDGKRYGSLPETSFVHAAGTSATASERLRGYYNTLTDSSSDKCVVLGYAGFDGDTSDGGLISHWQTWLKDNDDGKLGAFFHDDFSSDDFTGYLNGGMCPPFTGTHGTGSVVCQTALEYPDAAALQAAHHAFLEQVTRPATGKPMPTLYNGCPQPSGGSYYTSETLVNPSSFETDPATRAVAIGCEAEGVLSSHSPATVDMIPGTGVYAKNVATLLNDISVVASPSFTYMLLDYGDPDTSLRLNERYFDLGVAWLAYEPGTRNVVQFDDFNGDAANATEFFAEQLLVPWDPATSMAPYDEPTKAHGEHDLRVDSFTYVDSRKIKVEAAIYCREFGSLYQGHLRTVGGAPNRIGSGAVCVNTSSSARPILASYLKKTYAHVITFPDGAIDVPGATLDMTTPFSPGQTQVGAGSAVFLLGQ